MKGIPATTIYWHMTYWCPSFAHDGTTLKQHVVFLGRRCCILMWMWNDIPAKMNHQSISPGQRKRRSPSIVPVLARFPQSLGYQFHNFPPDRTPSLVVIYRCRYHTFRLFVVGGVTILSSHAWSRCWLASVNWRAWPCMICVSLWLLCS